MSDIIQSPNIKSDSGKSLSQSQQPSALSALIAADLKTSSTSEVGKVSNILKQESFIVQSTVEDEKLPLESFNFGPSQSYNYASNSFYQSYGESYDVTSSVFSQHDEPKQPAEIIDNKAWVTVKELLSLIVEDATQKEHKSHEQQQQPLSLDRRLILDGEVDLLTKIDSLKLLPAEENGYPMEDLPDCTSTSDILNMGVRDFIVIDKRSKIHLVHIRIEGNINQNEPYEGLLPVSEGIQVVGEDHPLLQLERQTSDQTDSGGGDNNSYYTLEEDGENAMMSADSIQFFRTDTDELRLQELQKAVEELRREAAAKQAAAEEEQEGGKMGANNNRKHRHRTSSGNLIISYRRPGSERWRVAKTLTVLTETALKEHDAAMNPPPSSRPPSNDRKSQIAQQIRNRLHVEANEIPIPLPNTSPLREKKSQSFTVQREKSHQSQEGDDDLPLERRHSDRPYDEERDGDWSSAAMKYGRGGRAPVSRASSRSSSFLDLNPHTSISLSAMQFSPAHSIHSREEVDSDGDDQLGLIQIERSNHLTFRPTPPLTNRSLGRDESTYSYSLPFPSSSSVGSPGGHALRRKRTEGGGEQSEDAQRSFSGKSMFFGGQDDDDEEEEEDGGSSSDEDERMPSHLTVNTQVKLVPQTLKKHSQTARGRANPYRQFPHSLYSPNTLSGGGGETGSQHGSDKSSSRSSVTSTKSAWNRLMELFGGAPSPSVSANLKRPSFASESNDSVYSGSSTPRHHHNRNRAMSSSRRSEGGIAAVDEEGRGSLSQQIDLPIIANLDTGDIIPVGALRYEAFKLPETVSPSVLFGKPSDKIHR